MVCIHLQGFFPGKHVHRSYTHATCNRKRDRQPQDKKQRRRRTKLGRPKRRRNAGFHFPEASNAIEMDAATALADAAKSGGQTSCRSATLQDLFPLVLLTGARRSVASRGSAEPLGLSTRLRRGGVTWATPWRSLSAASRACQPNIKSTKINK